MKVAAAMRRNVDAGKSVYSCDMSRVLRTICVGLVMCGCAAVDAQQGQVAAAASADEPVIQPVVTLPTIVRDHKTGAIVSGLTKDDFLLKVRDSEQTIVSAKQDADMVPISLGLLVDVSRGLRDDLDGERAASKAFLAHALQPSSGGRGADEAFVVHFSKAIEMLQDMTPDQAKLGAAARLIGTASKDFALDPPADVIDREGRHIHNGGISLYDALYLSTDKVLAGRVGRRVIVLVSDGVDDGSQNTLSDLVDQVQTDGVVIYGIYLRSSKLPEQDNRNRPNIGPYPGGYPGGGYPGGGYPGGGYPGGGYPGGNAPNGGNNPNGGNTPNGPGAPSRKPQVDGHQVMARLCGETGGQLIELSRREPLEAAFQQILDDLHGTYRLQFLPQGRGAGEGLHRIDLSLRDPEKDKKLDIQVQSSYYVSDAGSK
jgi:VWFA-related protein